MPGLTWEERNSDTYDVKKIFIKDYLRGGIMDIPVLPFEELETDIRKDYKDFRVRDETGYVQDLLIWTMEAQRDDTCRKIAEWVKKNGSTAYIFDGQITGYDTKCDNIIILDLGDWQELIKGE